MNLEAEIIYREIQEQPAIAARWAARAAPPWPAGGRVVVTGAGDSLAAAELVGHAFPQLGMQPLAALEASAVAPSLGHGDALIGISVSGRTPRVIEAVRRARGRGARGIAVTDDPASALARAADAVWPIGASPPGALETSSYVTPGARDYVGYHHDVAQTKSFVGALLALARAAAGAAGTAEGVGRGGVPSPLDFNDLAGLLAVLNDPVFLHPIQDRAATWATAGQTFFLAEPSTLPIARFGAYKMFEFNRPAHFTDIEEYCHTHYFITRPRDLVVFLIQHAAAERRAAEIASTLVELFDARTVAIRAADVAARFEPSAGCIEVPAAAHPFRRLLATVVAVEWMTYLCGRVGAPDINTFHAGYDTERLVAASLTTIRHSAILDAAEEA